MQTIVCMKWGPRYPADYVNRLWSAIQRHTERPTRLICFTDDSDGVDPQVACFPLPPINIPERVSRLGWRKISLWQPGLPELEGDVLFLDLDMVITGGLDVFFDYMPGHYCVIENWSQRGLKIGNTSLYRFPVGQHTYIFDRFNEDGEAQLAKYPNSQTYISREIEDINFWPADWCVSFKHSLIPAWPLNFFITPKLPKDARAVAFTGKPDPDEAEIGVWPVKKPWKKLYKHVRPTKWITENWR